MYLHAPRLKQLSGFGSDSRYPYPFLDVDLIGWDKVILIVLTHGGHDGLGIFRLFLTVSWAKSAKNQDDFNV